MELMVVIGIIAILATIIMPGFSDSRKKARDSERVSELGQLAVALELYYGSCKEYPTAPLVVGIHNGCSGTITLGSFIDPIPVDPVNSAPSVYTYDVNGTHSSYRLQAVLETNDTSLNNDSDAASWGGPSCLDANKEYCVGR